MMRDEDKPFILTKYSWGGFNIEPRNARGWRLMLTWLALPLPLIGGFALFTEKQPDSPAFAAVLAVFVLAMAIWAIGGIIWMRARSEVVDVEQLLRLKREQERKRRGR
ncbi:MAG TPA: hypothetical protein VLA50_08415 [Erythrobacter sp.]|nr:hypothetical protein [Erythrobacter sp.]